MSGARRAAGPSKGFVAAVIVVVTLAVAVGGGYVLLNWASRQAREDAVHRADLEQQLAAVERRLGAFEATADDWEPAAWPRLLADLEAARPMEQLQVLHRVGDGAATPLRDAPVTPVVAGLTETLLRTPTEGPVTTLVQELDPRTRLVAVRHQLTVGGDQHVFLAVWTEERP